MNLSMSIKSYKVKFCTFLGREKNISILHRYVLQGLEETIIDEYHMFDFARNLKDHDFICSEYTSMIKLYPGRVFIHYSVETKERLEKKDFGVDWKLFYSSLPLFCDDSSIIIKCDDDILFIDLDGLKSACDYRWEDKDSFLIHSNCINNGICSYYYKNKFPEIEKELEEFPVGGLIGPIFEKPTLAAVMHSLFICYLTKNFKKEGIHANINYYRDVDTFFYHRISINFIMMLGTDINHIFEVSKNDEYELSCYLPEKLGRPNRIKGDFITSHYSYNLQEKILSNRKDIIDLYDVLATKYLDERDKKMNERVLTKWFPPQRLASDNLKSFKMPMEITNWWRTDSYHICTSDERFYLTSHFKEDVLKVVPSSDLEKSIFKIEFQSWEKGELTEENSYSEKVRIKHGLFYITQFSYIGNFRNERIFLTTSKIDEEKDIYLEFMNTDGSDKQSVQSDKSDEEHFLIRFRKKKLYLNVNSTNDGIEVTPKKKTWWKMKRPYWAGLDKISVTRFEENRIFYYQNVETNEIHRPYYMGWGLEL